MWSLFAARKIKGSQHSEMCVLDLLKNCSFKNVSVWKWTNTLGKVGCFPFSQLEEFYSDEQTKTQGGGKTLILLSLDDPLAAPAAFYLFLQTHV